MRVFKFYFNIVSWIPKSPELLQVLSELLTTVHVLFLPSVFFSLFFHSGLFLKKLLDHFVCIIKFTYLQCTFHQLSVTLWSGVVITINQSQNIVIPQ